MRNEYPYESKGIESPPHVSNIKWKLGTGRGGCIETIYLEIANISNFKVFYFW